MLVLRASGASAVLIGAGLGLHLALTQSLLFALVAAVAPPDLRGTAFGVFNLVSGVALLVASGLAGLLWDLAGPAWTFYAGAAFTLVAWIGMLLRRRNLLALQVARTASTTGSARRTSRTTRRARTADAVAAACEQLDAILHQREADAGLIERAAGRIAIHLAQKRPALGEVVLARGAPGECRELAAALDCAGVDVDAGRAAGMIERHEPQRRQLRKPLCSRP